MPWKYIHQAGTDDTSVDHLPKARSMVTPGRGTGGRSNVVKMHTFNMCKTGG